MAGGSRGGRGRRLAVVAGWPAEGEVAQERRRPGGAEHLVGGGRRRGRGESGSSGAVDGRRAGELG